MFMAIFLMLFKKYLIVSYNQNLKVNSKKIKKSVILQNVQVLQQANSYWIPTYLYLIFYMQYQKKKSQF